MKAPAGEIEQAWLDMTRTSAPPTRGADAVRTAGLRYERKVVRFLREMYPLATIGHALTLGFVSDEGYRICIPDVLMLFDYHVIVAEIKHIQSVGRASDELRSLYGPVVRRLLPRLELRLVEITRQPDPDRTQVMLSHPLEAIHHPPDGVYLWPYSGRF